MEESVYKIYNKIKTDPRHTDLIILQRREISVRNFENWSMGFKGSSRAEFEQIEGYLDLRKQVEINGNDSMNQVKMLLIDFINNNR